MKKSFKLLMTLAAAAIALIACSKEEEAVPVITSEDGIQVIINTGSPVTMTMMSGSTPYWCDGDAIGVTNGSSDKQKKFDENSIGDGETASTATFSGSVASTGTYYAYYPYTSNGVTASGCAKVDIPTTQNPTATSFDGKADILISKSFTVSTTETTTVNNLEFARLGAIVKVVLIDGSGTYDLSGEHPASVALTAASNLVGRVYVDMVNQELGELYYGQSATVTAEYTVSTKFAINGSNAAYFIVYPQTLAAGSTLTVSAATENYAISKDITVPVGGITLEGGKVTTLNITLADAHITPAATGDPLPFNDDMSWQTTTGNSGLSFDSTPAIPSAKYSAFNLIYAGSASGVIRMSKGDGTGYLTTVGLDLSSAFYVHINSKYWSDSDATHLFVSVDDGSPEEITLTGSYADYYVNFAAATSKSKVKVTTTANKRAFIKAFDVISGTYVFPPVINVTTDNPMDVANTASSQTIEYTIDNPTAATLTAALQDPSDTWISNIDYSSDGEVTFDVAAQETDAAARSAVIVLSYTGADDVEVTINQAAGPSSGGTQDYTVTWTATSGALGGSGDYITSAGGTASGSISTTCATPSLSYSWSFTRTLVQLKSGKTDYLGWSSNHIQVGSSSALNTIEFTTSNIPGTIKSVSIVCYGNAHQITASVDGTSYIASTTLSSTSDTYTGTGTSSGTISISITNTGTTYKAFYIKSITVVYNN